RLGPARRRALRAPRRGGARRAQWRDHRLRAPVGRAHGGGRPLRGGGGGGGGGGGRERRGQQPGREGTPGGRAGGPAPPRRPAPASSRATPAAPASHGSSVTTNTYSVFRRCDTRPTFSPCGL